MPSMKMIRRRLTSVTNTKKIMKAMNMVAASKLQKNKSRLEDARPFFDEAKRLINNLKICAHTENSVFMTPKPVKNTVYLVITGDRGLCGSFNTNAAEKALSHMSSSCSERNKVIAAGLKGCEYFKRNGIEVIRKYDGVLETAFHEDASRIGRFLMDLYTSGEADEIYITYTKFESVLTHVPKVIKILPIDSHSQASENPGEMKYEPDIRTFFDRMIPIYMTAAIYYALLESSACEQASRMISMDTAEKNASDIIDKLTRVYNRRRQTAITQEISEIVSGTNVMNSLSGAKKQRGESV